MRASSRTSGGAIWRRPLPSPPPAAAATARCCCAAGPAAAIALLRTALSGSARAWRVARPRVASRASGEQSSIAAGCGAAGVCEVQARCAGRANCGEWQRRRRAWWVQAAAAARWAAPSGGSQRWRPGSCSSSQLDRSRPLRSSQLTLEAPDEAGGACSAGPGARGLARGLCVRPAAPELAGAVRVSSRDGRGPPSLPPPPSNRRRRQPAALPPDARLSCASVTRDAEPASRARTSSRPPSA